MKPLVLLLAAGKSSRMEPLGDKIFTKYLGKELILHQLENITSAGLDDIIIVCNEINITKLKKIIKVKKGMRVQFVIQPDLKEGIKGAVVATKKLLPKDKAVLIISSNDYVEKSLYKEVLTKAQKSNPEILMAAKIVDKYFPGGYLQLDNKGFIKTIIEKPNLGEEPSSLVVLMVQYFKNIHQLINEYNNITNELDDAHEQGIQLLLNKGIKAEVAEYKGFWQPIKYPFHQLLLMKYFLDSLKKTYIHPRAQVSKNTTINGICYLEEGVKIFDFAVIQGPCYIGKNTIIGNHSLVRGSHLGENCVIGAGSDICRSYFKNYIWTHQNFIGDSVIEKNVSFGAGARTANLRLDEENIQVNIKGQEINSNTNKLGAFIGKNVRIGINTSIMPGIKIGKNTFIASGIVVDNNISENSFVKTKNELIKKDNFKNTPTRDSFKQ